ncbi:MAG: YybS family protein [candidate division Zixibacteria bacterium]|nr:YybS family protein [candidate division Zixibacteria bacterium]
MERNTNSSLKNKKWIWASLSLLLTLGYALLSGIWVVSYLLGILLTLCLTIFFWRSRGYGLIGAIFLTALFYILREDNLVVFLSKCLLPALLLSLGLRYKRSPGLVIFLAIIPHLVILGLTIVHYGDMVFIFKDQLGEIAQKIAGLLEIFGINAIVLQTKIFSIFDILAQLIFGFQLLSSWVEVFLIYFFIQLIGDKLGWDMIKLTPFGLWHSQEGFAWVALLSLVLFLVGGKLFEIVSKNIALVFGFWYTVVGVSISEWFFRKSKVNAWIKILFYVFVLVTQILSFVLLSLLGFFDSWLDFRKLGKKSLSNKGVNI